MAGKAKFAAGETPCDWRSRPSALQKQRLCTLGLVWGEEPFCGAASAALKRRAIQNQGLTMAIGVWQRRTGVSAPHGSALSALFLRRFAARSSLVGEHERGRSRLHV